MTLKRNPNCTLCKLHKTAEFVCLLGQGPEPCDVMIVGEAPGKREDASGKAFVGKAGQLLEELLETNDFSRDTVFITNAVSCRPPDNRKPSKGEIKACNKWLHYQISMVKPKYVLLLGGTAYQAITGGAGIKKARGRPFEKDGIIFLPTYHPASTFYDPATLVFIESDIALFREIIDNKGIPRENDLRYTSVETWDQFGEMIEALKGVVSFDLETTGLYPWGELENPDDMSSRKQAAITHLGFGTASGEYMVPWTHPDSPWLPDDLEIMLERIEERLPDCLVVTHFGKFDALWMAVVAKRWWHRYIDFDTGLAHYILDENSRHGLKELAQTLCGAPDWDIDDDKKKGLRGLPVLALYHAHDLFYTRQLYYILKKRLSQDGDVERVFHHILMPALRLYTEIEYDGVCIDKEKFDKTERYLNRIIARLERSLNEYSKLENWGSPKQVGELLFDELGIEPPIRTPKGGRSTSESALKQIDHPLVATLIKYRGAKQQLSFFINGWKPYLVNKNGEWFLHPSFKLHGTVTGRPSCEHPNLQQVPRDEIIRSMIIAPKGWTLVEADLEQIELKIVAELSRDPEMMHAFLNGVDIHWLTMIRELERGAGQADLVLDTARTYKQDKSIRYAEALEIVFEMGPAQAEEIRKEWKEMRKRAKAINFGYVYGMWWKKFKMYARDNYDIIVTDEEAQESRKSFFSLYKLEGWHKRQKTYARRNGYVRSLSGRKRRLPRAQSSEDTPDRREAERQAVNSPVQGFASDINLMSVLQLREEYTRREARPVGTVHDSILFWVKNEKVEQIASRLLQIMSRPKAFDLFEIDMDVPITADAKIGPWSIGMPFKKWRKEHGNAR